MDFLGFTLSVWVAIGLGVFFVAMVVACNLDRHRHESLKWWVFALGLIAVGVLVWRDPNLGWQVVFTAGFWKAAGAYLGLGVLYSLVEFRFQIRREARVWAQRWEHFQVHWSPSPNARQDQDIRSAFVDHSNSRYSGAYLTRMVKAEAGSLAPEIDRKDLSQAIGCWTLFWPAYALSLALGDLLTELWQRMADVLTAISARFVSNTFHKAFTDTTVKR